MIKSRSQKQFVGQPKLDRSQRRDVSFLVRVDPVRRFDPRGKTTQRLSALLAKLDIAGAGSVATVGPKLRKYSRIPWLWKRHRQLVCVSRYCCAMALALTAILDQIETAITALTTGGHTSYSIGSRSVTKLDLKTLFEERRTLIEEIARESPSGSRVIRAKFVRTGR